jgi:hypothetical protein
MHSMAYQRRAHNEGIKPGLLELFALAALIFIAVAVPAAIVFGPPIYAKLSAYLASTQAPPPPLAPSVATSFDYYFVQKNKSCALLSNDFLIVTHDQAYGDIQGLLDSPGQNSTAAYLLSQYEYDQITRTYLKGDWLKRTVQVGDANHTTIWKDGRIYQCSGNCTMHLLGDAGWQAHLDEVQRIQTGCAFFGRVKLPGSVNMTRLLRVERAGSETLHGSTCEKFLITGDKEYASSLLDSTSLDPDQEAVLWSISHQALPVEECLDEGSGLLISRSIALDLTKTYKLDYSQDGYMHLVQKTEMTYYTDYVPASFFTAD